MHWKDEDELCAFVAEKLSSLNFSCCCGLESILVWDSVIQEDSVRKCEYLVSETNEIFFNDTSDFDLLTSTSRLTTELFYKINGLFSNQLKEFCYAIQQIIEAKNEEEMKRILFKISIPELNDEFNSTRMYLHEPGTLVSKNFHFSLYQNFTYFTKGEYVGFELEDPVELGCQGEPKLIYAVVDSEVSQDGSPSADHLKIYSIWISCDELIEVPAAMLYKIMKPVNALRVDENSEVQYASNEAILENVVKILHDISCLPIDLQNK